jgi:tripartite-type tricarboxylate transporter receptor subunit TctC
MKLATFVGVGAAAMMAFAAGASAQSYPDQTVKIIVPFGAGSVTDTGARTGR